VLHAGLQRLALEHPHHTLYHILALRNGLLGPDGKPAAAVDRLGVIATTVDQDKARSKGGGGALWLPLVAAQPGCCKGPQACDIRACDIRDIRA
jgi:hypothetical protein